VARPLALAAALAVSLLAVSGAGGAATQQTPKRGGTVVVGTMREQACVNAYFLRCGDTLDTSNLMRLALRGAFRIGPGLSWRPDLVAGADFTRRPPFTITYHIRPDAQWSDGVPVTARDFEFTHETRKAVAEQLINFEKEHLNRIRSVRAIDAKTVEVVLDSKFAAWRGLFPHVLPRHALQGEDFSRVWLDRIHNPKTGAPIGSGPFLFRSWERGRAVTFVRNPRYWGPHSAHLDGIVVLFCRECADLGSEQIGRLRAQELDLVANTPFSGEETQTLRRIPGVRVLVAPGPVWEHVEFRIGQGGHPALKRKRVRRAIAYGIDRVAIVGALYGAVDSRYPPSDSAVWPSGSARYRPRWQAYRYRPSEARRLLEQEGCRRGSDGVYVCDGERLSLRFVTTGDDPLRVRTVELVQSQLRRAGIEVRPVHATRSAVFGQILPTALSGKGEFDLVMFAFTKSTPDAPAQSKVIYGCGDIRNYSGYCQRHVTRDLDQAIRILDDADLARVLNRADAQLAKDVPVIPLLERPLVAAFTTSLRNVSLETRGLDPFAGIENWWLDR
jgi:ABC-type transport system substrate-binding protein